MRWWSIVKIRIWLDVRTFILTNPGSNSCHNWKTHEMLIFGHPRSLHFTWFLKFCIVSRSFVFGVTYVILCSFLCYSFRFYKTFGHSGEELHWTRLWLRQRSVQLSRCSLSSQAARNCDLCVCVCVCYTGARFHQRYYWWRKSCTTWDT